MKTIYNNPKSNQTKELDFQKHLIEYSDNYKHISETYTLSLEEFKNPFLNIREIESQLLKFNKLSLEKKNNVLNSLHQLPDRVRVAERNYQVSIDFLIIDENNEKHFIEFHEKQHRDLSVTRQTPIFDENYNRFEIPRYVQRFLKDIWRLENLKNYKIVWFDWFEYNKNYSLNDLINWQTKELNQIGRFSFMELINKNIA